MSQKNANLTNIVLPIISLDALIDMLGEVISHLACAEGSYIFSEITG
jgi:hypothetical protein